MYKFKHDKHVIKVQFGKMLSKQIIMLITKRKLKD